MEKKNGYFWQIQLLLGGDCDAIARAVSSHTLTLPLRKWLKTVNLEGSTSHFRDKILFN